MALQGPDKVRMRRLLDHFSDAVALPKRRTPLAAHLPDVKPMCEPD